MLRRQVLVRKEKDIPLPGDMYCFILSTTEGLLAVGMGVVVGVVVGVVMGGGGGVFTVVLRPT